MLHDPEVPAGYQDADILQAQYEAESRRARARQAAGICQHGHVAGPRNPDHGAGLGPEQLCCLSGCGWVFDSDSAWRQAVIDAA